MLLAYDKHLIKQTHDKITIEWPTKFERVVVSKQQILEVSEPVQELLALAAPAEPEAQGSIESVEAPAEDKQSVAVAEAELAAPKEVGPDGFKASGPITLSPPDHSEGIKRPFEGEKSVPDPPAENKL